MEVIEIFSGKRQFLKGNQVLEVRVTFLFSVELAFNHSVLLYDED